jgi:hypothetical protein
MVECLALAQPVAPWRIQLAANEDQAGDAERAHVGENVSYLVFEDAALRLEGDARDDAAAAEVTLDAVEAMLWQAAALWDTSDSSDASELLDRLEVQVRDLSGSDLARVQDNTLLVDINAAGTGWFVDPTPTRHEEYSEAA